MTLAIRTPIPPDPEATRDLSKWEEHPLGALIDHIVGYYHRRAREDLAALIKIAARVEAVHANEPGCPDGLAAYLATAEQALDYHMRKEERVLFPLIRSGGGGRAGGPMRVMEIEHHDHRALLGRIRILAGDLVPPPGACATWCDLYRRLAAFETDMLEHIRLENKVLFPRAQLE